MKYIFAFWILFFSLFVFGQSEFERYWVISGKGYFHISDESSIDTFYLDDTIQIFDNYNEFDNYVEFGVFFGNRISRRWEIGLNSYFEYRKRTDFSEEIFADENTPVELNEQLVKEYFEDIDKNYMFGFYLKYFLLQSKRFELYIQTSINENYYYIFQKESKMDEEVYMKNYTQIVLNSGCAYRLSNRLRIIANFGKFQYSFYKNNTSKKYNLQFKKIPIGVMLTF